MEQIEEKKSLTIEELQKTHYALTNHVLSELKRGLAMDLTVEEACFMADINKDTYYAWLKLSDEFAFQMNKARTKLFVKAKENIERKVNEGDSEMSMKLLERRQKKLYALRSELTGADGEALETGVTELRQIANNLSKLVDEQVEKSPVDTDSEATS